MQHQQHEIGVVCGQCDTWSPISTTRCPVCSNDLSLFTPQRQNAQATGASRTTSPQRSSRSGFDPQETGQTEVPRKQPAHDAKAQSPRSEFADLSQEELMEQARNFVCRSCSSGVPTGHKFCGRCGTAVPVEILNAQTLFFGDMQNPAKAKLILIRGEGMDGLSYHLKAEQHIVGRNGQIVFPDDPFVSPKHANFFYRDAKLVVRDEGSLNGVYIRVRGTVDITPGDTFLAGEQVFRLDPTPRASDGQDTDGTYFYSSPKHPSPFRLTQILQGGAIGMTVCARGSSLQIGREGGDLNFPVDLYMSASHCRIDEHGGKFSLTDLNSRNGTYVRIKAERELQHGDYLFVGRKLLRVEMNTN
ncbi:phosphopeptide-binding protein [Chondromyces crocatus]|uniref:Phosphopeptide-binding protein n=2 Tax=Chondromyces crocatus TaxID=52 RepID=A0A0K1E5W8_CHOCO|nr:phosphopeptide-binding protein [Chondromyces crocatus]